jgi:hypothetical protein
VSPPPSGEGILGYLPRLMPLAGVLLFLIGLYASGGVHTTCRRTDGRVDCHTQTLRILELCSVGTQDAHDVVKVYDVTSTSASASPRAHSSSSNTVVLQTRDGTLVYAFGDTSHGAGEHVTALSRFLEHPERTSVQVFSSNWTFGLAAMAFGAVWTAATGFAAASMRNGG